MVTRKISVYSEQALTPRAAQVISAIKQSYGYEEVEFVPWVGIRSKAINDTVLVFGNKLPDGAPRGVNYIHTYSIAQIMSKANAATALSSGIRLALGDSHRVPDGLGPVRAYFDQLPSMFGLDYDRPVAIDIETDGNLGKTHTPDEVNIISVALYQWPHPPLVYTNPSSDEYGSLALGSMSILMLRGELPKFKKAIYHNGKFDTRVLNRVLGVKLEVWFDTMLAHHVLNMAAGVHGLKPLAQRYLGAPEWEAGLKQHLKTGGHYERIPVDKLVVYNGWDVYWTYQLWELFAPQIEADPNNEMAFMLELEAAKMLLEVEVNGIPMDLEATKLLSEQQVAIMKESESNLQHLLANPDFNPNSPQQVKKALESVGVHVPSTNKEEIERLYETAPKGGHVSMFCEDLLAFRKAAKINGTYAVGWSSRSRNGRVHPTFLVHGTSTGRLSSTGPNAQNVPRNKEVRKIVGVK